VDWLGRVTGGTDQRPRLAIAGLEIEGEVRGGGLGERNSNPTDWRLEGADPGPRGRSERLVSGADFRRNDRPHSNWNTAVGVRVTHWGE